ncbi:MAG: hypothetical protein V4653_02320 [Pseudomonadota bacterium]
MSFITRAVLLLVLLLPARIAFAQADEARARADARPWAATVFVGSSVADGKLRDLIFAPQSGSWGDDTLAGITVGRRLARFATYFMVDAEIGGAYRSGETNGGEVWAALYLRYDGFPWTDYVYTTIGVSMGPDFVTRLPRVERGSDARPERNQSRFLNFFSPEITFALPSNPEHEVSLRYIHRSGIFGLYNGVYEGANAFVIGYRYRF